jgi:hypothetical protein
MRKGVCVYSDGLMVIKLDDRHHEYASANVIINFNTTNYFFARIYNSKNTNRATIRFTFIVVYSTLPE